MAEDDLATFVRLLQVTNSLFLEVDELKHAISAIGESIGVVGSGSLRN